MYFFLFYLAVHSVQLVVEGHGEVGGGTWGHVGDKGCLALVDCVVHVDTTLADLHVLEARLHTELTESAGDRRNEYCLMTDGRCYFTVQNDNYVNNNNRAC